MYTRYSNPLGYGVCTYVCDTDDDLASCPTSTAAVGSIAIIIKTSETYILDHSKKWVLRENSSGGGGGIDPTKYYIYDGGVVE